MHLRIYTDGSCLGNPGPGGWAYLIRVAPTEGQPQIVRGQGGEADTTNNRMEMLAAIEALRLVQERWPTADLIDLYSDSSLLINTMNLNWKRKKNLDLWDKLSPLLLNRSIRWNWVKGHNGHPENEDCDERAQREAAAQAKKPRAKPQSSPGTLL